MRRTLTESDQLKETIALLSRLMMGAFATLLIVGGGIASLLLMQRDPESPAIGIDIALQMTGIGMFGWGVVLLFVSLVLFLVLLVKILQLINRKEKSS